MLRFIYSSDSDDTATDEVSSCLFNVRMVAVADKYLIRNLASVATAKVKKAAGVEWQSTGFAEAISEAYTKPPLSQATLCKTITSIILENKNALIGGGDENKRFVEMMGSTPKFAADLVQLIVPTLETEKTSRSLEMSRAFYKCPHCQLLFQGKIDKTVGRHVRANAIWCRTHHGGSRIGSTSQNARESNDGEVQELSRKQREIRGRAVQRDETWRCPVLEREPRPAEHNITSEISALSSFTHATFIGLCTAVLTEGDGLLKPDDRYVQ